jgi:lipopolysaccharide heptosyltransferase II
MSNEGAKSLNWQQSNPYICKVKKILLIQTAFLGDVILATPVAAELKRIFPEATIDFLVKKGNSALLQNNPNLRYIITFDKRKGKYRSMLHLIRQIRSEQYDLVVNLHRFGSSGLLTSQSKAKQKIGFKKNPFSFLYTQSFPHEISNGTHEVNRNLSLLQSFGAVAFRRPELFPSKANYATILPYTSQPFYCIAPASVWLTKQLPITKWVELLQQLANSGNIYLVGGKEDSNLCAEILAEANVESAHNLAGKFELLDTAALFSKAKRVFVNDSGPMHIASAMNAPVTAFFCSTTPDFGFGPLSEDSEIRQVANLPCRPCGLHGHKSCPKGHFNCGNHIQIG